MARKTYLLQNLSAGYVGNSPLFWRDGGSGYTPWINEAKHWTYREAQLQIRSTRGSHQWKIWDIEYVEAVAKLTVDINDLRLRTSK